MEDKVKCTRKGCRKTFKYREQLRRHKKVCTFMSPQRIRSYEKVQDSFQCNGCLKMFKHRASVLRHVNDGTCKKTKEEHVCHYCNKMFQYKSYLARHLQTHREDILLPSFTVSSEASASRSPPGYDDSVNFPGEAPSSVTGDGEIEPVLTTTRSTTVRTQLRSAFAVSGDFETEPEISASIRITPN